MNTPSRYKIKQIATDVRKWAEEFQTQDNRISKDLCGLCAKASGELYRRLKIAGIESTLHLWNYGHVYVSVEDYIIDVTATQFSEFRNKPVVILHIKEAEIYSFYQSDREFRSAKELRIYQKKAGWPPHQFADH